jgi:heme-degrading monooxygenase HmoA
LAIKVIIERQVKAGYEELVWGMVRDLRSQAVRQRGYLYGETWRSMDNPRVFLVISTWGRREYWDRWVNDEFRRKVEERIKPLLRRPSTVRIFEETTTLPTDEARTSKESRLAAS